MRAELITHSHHADVLMDRVERNHARQMADFEMEIMELRNRNNMPASTTRREISGESRRSRSSIAVPFAGVIMQHFIILVFFGIGCWAVERGEITGRYS